MRTVQPINRDWLYTPAFSEAYTAPGFAPEAAGWQQICLPHTNLELPFNGFDETVSHFVSSYWRQLTLPAGYSRFFLDFEGVMTAAEVWVNGRHAGGHKGGYTPFSIELTSIGRAGETLNILVQVDSTERADIPPFGHVVDYLCYGGIYREVQLRCQNDIIITDVYARPENVLADRKTLALELSLDWTKQAAAGVVHTAASNKSAADSAAAAGAVTIFSLDISLLHADSGAIMAELQLPVAPDNSSLKLSLNDIENLQLWDIDTPVLYDLRVRLLHGIAPVDEYRSRVGFRQAEFRADGFWLNGRRLPIRGLNRHQSWPYVGYAMPERAQRRDAHILKNELQVNLVRCSHYPQSRHFLDACDELGLLVFEEIPGWQHIGNQEWQDNSCADLQAMIMRDRNRPSIILWGVRINESADNHDYFARTNALARSLDPGRQTGGVRCIEGSELLEDVYTFNDFSHSGGKTVLRTPRQVTRLSRPVPYLVTEHNGHMYPTKRFDNEERLTEHALRHARVLDTALGMPGCAGAIGWCAFDYNTHKDFGSGDRICYHGVSDMFRHPKYAAQLYASQVDPKRRIVLEAGSLFAKGERCAARLLPIEIYTNCDSIVLYRSGKRIGEYHPERKTFPNLGHPPVIIRDVIGDQLKDSQFSPRDQRFLRRIVGIIFTSGFEKVSAWQKLRLALLLARYRLNMTEATELMARYAIGWGSKDESFELAGILDGQEVLRRSYGGDARAVRLELSADDQQLQSGDWDTTRVSIRALDQYGNLHPFTVEAITVQVEGPASAIGPTLLPLSGGLAALWIRTSGEPGTVSVRVNSQRFGEQSLRIELR